MEIAHTINRLLRQPGGALFFLFSIISYGNIGFGLITQAATKTTPTTWDLLQVVKKIEKDGQQSRDSQIICFRL